MPTCLINNKNMKIEVRPIPHKKPWHGKTGKESFTRTKKIQALVDPETMTYATGLDNKDLDYLKNDLKVSYDLTNIYNPNVPHPFWDSPIAAFKLEDRPQIFDEVNPMDYIKIRMMKVSRYVANDLVSYENGEFPDATHVMYDEVQETENKASKVELKKRAFSETSKISKDKKIQVIRILGGKNVKGHSDAFVEVAMDELLTTRPQDVLEVLDRDAEDVENEALALEAVDKGILKNKGGKITYFESVLGYSVKDVAGFFSLDENQEIKLRIKESVNK